MTLGPHPRLIAKAREIRDTQYEARHDEPPAREPEVDLLHEAGYVRWVQVEAVPRNDGSIPSDRWVITDAGREWLAEHDKEN